MRYVIKLIKGVEKVLINIVNKTFKKMTKYLLQLESIDNETILLEINKMNDSIND
jgi:hypothetical protein